MRSMRITLSKGAAVGAAALLGVSVLAGCSSSDDSSSEETTTSETASEESGGSMDGGSQMLPPVIVEPGQTEASATVGDFIDIVVEEIVGTTIATDNPEILKISQAYDDGSALFNPGAEALAPGTATITVTTPDNTSYDITVTVTE
jgi:hypothetical protein